MEIIDQPAQPAIVESFFELRQAYEANWFELWSKNPNPFVGAILAATDTLGVNLSDVSFGTNPASLGEVALHVLLRKMGAALKVTLNSVTFLAENPTWDEAPRLIEVFQDLAHRMQVVAGGLPASQECNLTLHVTPGSHNFGRATRRFVQEAVVSSGEFFGITRHRSDNAMTIDRSLKYPDGAFLRLQRSFAGDILIPQIAILMFDDEKEALKLLGIEGLLP